MTKAEKRLYIREVAKELWSAPDCTGRPVDCVKDAVALADELESFERKQDEEDANRPSCFGNYERVSAGHRNMQCTECPVFDKCQEKRGAK